MNLFQDLLKVSSKLQYNKKYLHMGADLASNPIHNLKGEVIETLQH